MKWHTVVWKSLETFCKQSEIEMTTLSSTDNMQRCLSSSLAENVAYHYVNLILLLIKYLKKP